MIDPPERSAERDAAIAALLPRVAAQGWTLAALRDAIAETGGDRRDAELLFPGGMIEAIEAFVDLADRRMVEAAAAENIAELRTSARVRAVLALRLRQSRDHREAIRRAAAILALPRNTVVAARCTARTVDAVWHLAGDRSADFSWYTKRATLAGVYAATLLYWLGDTSEDDAASLAFLDRRLAGVAGIGRLRKRAGEALARMAPGSRAA